MAFKVYCRECSWKKADPVELKGEANWIAGRHISDTGHSVAVKEVEDGEEESEPKEFFRSGDHRNGRLEILRPVPPEGPDEDAQIRECGPIDCVVASMGEARHS